MPAITWTDGARTTINATGKDLEATCHGPSPDDAPTIVMLHDGLGSVGAWQDLPQQLSAATGFGVLAYSRAGYGESDPADLPRPLDYLSREALETLPDVLDAAGFTRGILLGHGDGAAIASIYEGSVEDFRIRGLVLIAPRFFTEPSGLDAIAGLRPEFESGTLRDQLAQVHRDPDHAFRGWTDAWLDPDFRAWDITEMIDYWRIPVLAVQGDADPYGTIAHIREIEGHIYSPINLEILAGTGHAPHLEQPERTLNAIAEFTARLERIERATVETD